MTKYDKRYVDYLDTSITDYKTFKTPFTHKHVVDIYEGAIELRTQIKPTDIIPTPNEQLIVRRIKDVFRNRL